MGPTPLSENTTVEINSIGIDEIAAADASNLRNDDKDIKTDASALNNPVTQMNPPLGYVDIDSLIRPDINESFHTPEDLYQAIQNIQWLDTVVALVEYLPAQCFVNYYSHEGLSPLELAIMMKREIAFTMLEKYYEDANNIINPVIKSGTTLLEFARIHNNEEIAQYISRKLSQNVRTDLNALPLIEYDALIKAVMLDSIDYVNMILKNNPSLLDLQFSHTDSEGNTPLHLAIGNKRIDIALVIIKNPIFKVILARQAKNKFGLTPIQLAMHFRLDNVVKELFEAFPSQELKDYMPLLVNAVQLLNLQYVTFVLSKIERFHKIEEWFPSRTNQICILSHAIASNRYDIVDAIWNRIGRNYFHQEILSAAIRTCRVDILEKVIEVFTKVKNHDIFKQYCHGLHPVNFAAKNGNAQIIQMLWDKMEDDLGLKYNIKGRAGYTTLHYAAEGGKLDVMEKIWSNISSQKVEDINPANKALVTPLHIAAKKNYPNIIDAIYSKMKNPKVYQLIPCESRGLTPLHIAAAKGYLKVFHCIMQKIPKEQIAYALNQKDANGSTVFYRAIANLKSEMAMECLKYEGVHLNGIGHKCALEFYWNAKNSKSFKFYVREHLRNNGCLEYRFQNGREGKVIQDIQGIHAASTTRTLQKSIEKLKKGKSIEDIDAAFKQFYDYCKVDNLNFIDDLKKIQINSSTFSRNLIVQALSNVSVEEAVKVFIKAIHDKFEQMASAHTYWIEFKERCGLIWFSIHDPIEQTKFNDVRVTSNPQMHIEAVDKLRIKFFVQLIETRFEYQAAVREDDLEDSDDSDDANDSVMLENNAQTDVYMDALLKSRPSCPGGTCNFVIEAFSFMHADIVVLEADLPPVYEVGGGLNAEIEHHLSTLITKSYLTHPKLFESMLDGLLGVSDEIITEEDVKQYILNVRNKNNIPTIGKFLGVMKSSLEASSDLITALKGGEQTLLNAFQSLEDALSRFQSGQLSAALISGYKESYQNKVRMGEIKIETDEVLNDLSLKIKLQEAFEGIDILQEKWFQQINSIELRGRIAKYLNFTQNFLSISAKSELAESMNIPIVLKFTVPKSESVRKDTDNPPENPKNTKKCRFV